MDESSPMLAIYPVRLMKTMAAQHMPLIRTRHALTPTKSTVATRWG